MTDSPCLEDIIARLDAFQERGTSITKAIALIGEAAAALRAAGAVPAVKPCSECGRPLSVNDWCPWCHRYEDEAVSVVPAEPATREQCLTCHGEGGGHIRYGVDDWEWEPCPCGGHIRYGVDDWEWEPCPSCGGAGYVPVVPAEPATHDTLRHAAQAAALELDGLADWLRRNGRRGLAEVASRHAEDVRQALAAMDGEAPAT